jgi:hypothetical protein
MEESRQNCSDPRGEATRSTSYTIKLGRCTSYWEYLGGLLPLSPVAGRKGGAQGGARGGDQERGGGFEAKQGNPRCQQRTTRPIILDVVFLCLLFVYSAIS